MSICLLNGKIDNLILSGFSANSRFSSITCSSSNGRVPNSENSAVKEVEKLLEEKRRAELSARIASGEFTVEKSGYDLHLNYRYDHVRMILSIFHNWCDTI